MFNSRSYAIKEHVGVFRMADHYDILDAESGRQLGVAREIVGGKLTMLRVVFGKRFLPTTVEFRVQDDLPVVLSLRRAASFFKQKVSVFDGDGRLLGSFKSKLSLVSGGFSVHDAADKPIAEVKGNWKGFSFKFLAPDGRELGTVDKQWGGLMKEMFTSADTYHIKLADDLGTNPEMAKLLLAAGIAIDVVYKES